MIDVSCEDLLPMLHAHAVAFMAADTGLSPTAAMVRACSLAVLIYDQVVMEAALQAAATEADVPYTLARIVSASGGASAALTPLA